MADQNSLTRDDTFGIRPDLFLALKSTKAANIQILFDALSGAEATAGKVTDDLQELNAQLQEHGEATPGGLIPAYIDANTRRWELQEQVDAAQDMVLESISDAQAQASAQVDEMTAQLRDIQQQLARKDENSILVPFNSSWSRSSKWVSTYRTGDAFVGWKHPTTALGNWKGILRYVRVGKASGKDYEETITMDFQIPREDGSRTVEIAGSQYTTSLEIIAFIEPGVQKTQDLTTQTFAPPVGTWVTIPEHTFTPPAEPAESYLLFWRVKWSAATHHDFYGVRIVQGGTVLATQTMDKLGPLLPSMPGDREQWVRVPRAVLRPNVPVEFLVYTTGVQDSQRAIAWAETNLSWIE